MDEPLAFTELNEFRGMLAEDLRSVGSALLSMREAANAEHMAGLMPKWKYERFARSISEAAASVLKAMDCLMPVESPSTESLIEQLKDRWEKSGNRDKEVIIAALRAAFKKKEPSNDSK